MNVLVVAAHPDDEVLGVGGTIARHSKAGDTVHILIVAEGATSRAEGSAEDVDRLIEAAKRAAETLGAEVPKLLGLPDNRLDTVALLDIIQPIEKVVRKISPEIVYTHHGNDLNLDHRIVHQATVTACRPLPGSSVRRLFGFEAPSSTEWSTQSLGPAFNPTHFVGIADTLDAKTAALECYEMEMRPFPHPRSTEAITALAQVRGSHAGLAAAEAFETILDIKH
jgi:LmbE family N-acetylglucosaminyl deacetylase